MSNSETLNLASLKMVQDELVATIEQSAVGLEQFANDRNNGELLQNCIDGIKQIRGTLSLIQLKGVDLLAEELVEHITEITLGEEPKTNRKLELLTSAFFILPQPSHHPTAFEQNAQCFVRDKATYRNHH